MKSKSITRAESQRGIFFSFNLLIKGFNKYAIKNEIAKGSIANPSSAISQPTKIKAMIRINLRINCDSFLNGKSTNTDNKIKNSGLFTIFVSKRNTANAISEMIIAIIPESGFLIC